MLRLKHYSSGMYVRLGFAVAVMVRPEILIVDEVIAVGDEEFQRKCYDYLYDLRRGGTSLIVVSHGLGQINDLCDEAIWLNAGVPQMLGPSRQVTKAYVDAVNAKELARGPGLLHTESADDPESRRGTGRIRVTDLQVFSQDGGTGGLISTGSPLTIQLSYSASEPTPEVSFSIAFEDTNGVAVLAASSGTESPSPVAAGSGCATLSIQDLLLAPGAYVVKTQVSSGSSVLDADDVGHPISIRPGSVAFSGLFRQPCTWRLS